MMNKEKNCVLMEISHERKESIEETLSALKENFIDEEDAFLCIKNDINKIINEYLDANQNQTTLKAKFEDLQLRNK